MHFQNKANKLDSLFIPLTPRIKTHNRFGTATNTGKGQKNMHGQDHRNNREIGRQETKVASLARRFLSAIFVFPLCLRVCAECIVIFWISNRDSIRLCAVCTCVNVVCANVRLSEVLLLFFFLFSPSPSTSFPFFLELLA